ncbi:MAG: hypothetical protein ACK5YO_25455, partial [Planctomyces sp.]
MSPAYLVIAWVVATASIQQYTSEDSAACVSVHQCSGQVPGFVLVCCIVGSIRHGADLCRVAEVFT